MALVLGLAVAFAASGSSVCPAQAAGTDETSVQTLARGAEPIQLEDMASSGHDPLGSFQSTDDPSDDPEPDNLGTERDVPGVILAFGVTGLDAPHSSRIRHHSAEAEAAVTRAVLPAVQPPRG